MFKIPKFKINNMKTHLLAISMLFIPWLATAKTIKYSYNSGGGCTSRTVFTLTQSDTKPSVQPSLNLKDLEIKTISDNIYISIAHEKNGINVSYVISNSLGQIVSSGTLSNTTNTIDISELPSGIYIITLTSEDDVMSQKFIKP